MSQLPFKYLLPSGSVLRKHMDVLQTGVIMPSVRWWGVYEAKNPPFTVRLILSWQRARHLLLGTHRYSRSLQSLNEIHQPMLYVDVDLGTVKKECT